MATELFWPNDARLAISFSLMFEAGGQPIHGSAGVLQPVPNQPRPHSLQRNRVPALDPSSLQHSGENADVSVIVLNNCAEHIGIFREIALR